MLRTLIISPDASLTENLQQALREFAADLTVFRVLNYYPDTSELTKVLRAHAPAAVFLSFQDPVQAAALAKTLCAEARGLQVVAVHEAFDPAMLRESMRAGIREFLTPPFERLTVSRALANVLQNLESCPVTYAAADPFLAFLPSKAGVGASSLALNISAALARPEHGRVLLGDLDLNSGTLRFLLNLTNKLSVVDAVVRADDLDERSWPAFVTPFGSLDVLHAGSVNPAIRLDHSQIGALIEFLRRNYRALCFDLSGNLERYSVEVMRQARVVLVCTPEIPALHLAREKMTYLNRLGLGPQVLVVLNRVTRHPLFSKDHVEDVLDAPVFATFSNDYAAFSEGGNRGTALDFQSPIGRECVAFVDKLRQKAAPAARHPKFLRHFTLARGGFEAPEIESHRT